MVLKTGHQLAHDLCFRPQAEGDENDDDKNFDIYSMVHIVEEQKQGWHIVSQIFSSAFKILKSINPHLKHAYIRSDNAGCYHALPLMGYLWKFRNELSLDVKQYDFSEAQSGKDLCDSRTGTCRLHMLNYMIEGNDITNGKQMKKALESHGGIKNMYISVTFGDSKIPETKPASIKSFRTAWLCFEEKKKAVRFSPKVKDYLAALFNAGELSGKKPSPYTVSNQMRNEIDSQGNRLFSPSEWLSHQQIRSFFGNLCIKKQKVEKSKNPSVEVVKIENDQEDDEDLQNVLSHLIANEHNNVLSEIVTGLTN
ncbi:unnamed protein product [Mytilus edulis]|uniref:Uncharacterized protein n=1 Tax=Mytilus edulis TaxID=6550 RepID=A0A8S3S441_MYTED|nr:unnamed protein product [Mytilus edulis]